MAAAQRCRGLAKIDCHALTPPGANLPQLRGREPACSESCSTGRADAERRRQHRIGTTGEHDIRCLPVTPTCDRQDRAKRFIRRGHDLVTANPWTPVIVHGAAAHIHPAKSLNCHLDSKSRSTPHRGSRAVQQNV